jgi:hypothetical protein
MTINKRISTQNMKIKRIYVTNRPNVITGTAKHSYSPRICVTWLNFDNCELSLLCTVFGFHYNCVFQTLLQECQRTVNGSSVEPLCSGHCVPFADRIEIIFSWRFKKRYHSFPAHPLSSEKLCFKLLFSASWKVLPCEAKIFLFHHQ